MCDWPPTSGLAPTTRRLLARCWAGPPGPPKHHVGNIPTPGTDHRPDRRATTPSMSATRSAKLQRPQTSRRHAWSEEATLPRPAANRRRRGDQCRCAKLFRRTSSWPHAPPAYDRMLTLTLGAAAPNFEVLVFSRQDGPDGEETWIGIQTQSREALIPPSRCPSAGTGPGALAPRRRPMAMPAVGVQTSRGTLAWFCRREGNAPRPEERGWWHALWLHAARDGPAPTSGSQPTRSSASRGGKRSQLAPRAALPKPKEGVSYLPPPAPNRRYCTAQLATSPPSQ